MNINKSNLDQETGQNIITEENNKNNLYKILLWLIILLLIYIAAVTLHNFLLY